MAVTIRLKRAGTKHRPYYHIVVADSRARKEGPHIEELGTYDPMAKGEADVRLDLEKAESWIGKGAKPSETVASLIRKARKEAAASS